MDLNMVREDGLCDDENDNHWQDSNHHRVHQDIRPTVENIDSSFVLLPYYNHTTREQNTNTLIIMKSLP